MGKASHLRLVHDSSNAPAPDLRLIPAPPETPRTRMVALGGWRLGIALSLVLCSLPFVVGFVFGPERGVQTGVGMLLLGFVAYLAVELVDWIEGLAPDGV